MRATSSPLVLLALLLLLGGLVHAEDTTTTALSTISKANTTKSPLQCKDLVESGIVRMKVDHKERDPFYRKIAERYALFTMVTFNNNTNSLKPLMTDVTTHIKKGNIIHLILDLIKAFYKNQYFARMSLIFGGLFVVGLILFLFILSILLCCSCCNCCCLKNKGCCRPRLGEVQWRWCLLFYHFMLLLAAALVLTGTIFFIFSIGDTFNSFNDKRMNSLLTDVRVYLSRVKKGITCITAKALEAVVAKVLNQLDNVANDALKYLMNATGLNNLSQRHGMADNFKNAGENLKKVQDLAGQMPGSKGKDLANKVKKLNEAQENLRGKLAEFTRGMRQAVRDYKESVTSGAKNMKKTQNPSSKIFQKLIDKMDETIDKMIKKVDGFMAKGGTLVTKFQKLIKRFSGIVKGVQAGLGVVMLIPFFFIGLVLGVAIYRFFFYEVFPEERKTQGWGHATVFFLYFTVIVAIILMIGAMILYFFGFMISMVCASFFKDADLRAMEEAEFAMESNKGVQVKLKWKIGDIIKACRNNGTIVHSILGKNALQVERMIEKLDLSYEKFGLDKKFNLDKMLSGAQGKKLFDMLDKALKNTSNQNSALNNQQPMGNDTIDQAMNAMQQSQNKLLNGMGDVMQNKAGPLKDFIEKIKNPAYTKSLIKTFIKETFDKMMTTLKGAMKDAIQLMDEDAPSCGPIFQEYENAGIVLCELVALPLHGAWASAGLVAMALLIPIIFYLIVAKWFYRPKLRWWPEKTALTPSDMEQTMREPTPSEKTAKPSNRTSTASKAKTSEETKPLLKSLKTASRASSAASSAPENQYKPIPMN